MNTFPRKPVGNKLIVLPLERKDVNLGNIIMPGTVQQPLSEGRVMAVSDEIQDLYSVGEVLIFPTNSGTGHMIEGVTYLVMQATEIWMINLRPE